MLFVRTAYFGRGSQYEGPTDYEHVAPQPWSDVAWAQAIANRWKGLTSNGSSAFVKLNATLMSKMEVFRELQPIQRRSSDLAQGSAPVKCKKVERWNPKKWSSPEATPE